LEFVGIWQSGAPLTVDEKNEVIYFSTANGNASNDSQNEYANSVIKSQPKFVGEKIVSFDVLDWFQPYDSDLLDADDDDLGSTQVLYTENSGILVTGSKGGFVYVMNMSNLGKSSVNNSDVHQYFRVTPDWKNSTYWYYNIHNILVWEGTIGTNLYVFGESDTLKLYRLSESGYFPEIPSSESTIRAPFKSMPGGILAISSFGKNNGILWVTIPYLGNANQQNSRGKLIAVNAEDMSEILWDFPLVDAFNESEIGFFAKFTPVVVHEGLVYVPTFSRQILIYGLQSPDDVQNPLLVIIVSVVVSVVVVVVLVVVAVVFYQKNCKDYTRIK